MYARQQRRRVSPMRHLKGRIHETETRKSSGTHESSGRRRGRCKGRGRMRPLRLAEGFLRGLTGPS